jgi:hypothetical protein
MRGLDLLMLKARFEGAWAEVVEEVVMMPTMTMTMMKASFWGERRVLRIQRLRRRTWRMLIFSRASGEMED